MKDILTKLYSYNDMIKQLKKGFLVGFSAGIAFTLWTALILLLICGKASAQSTGYIKGGWINPCEPDPIIFSWDSTMTPIDNSPRPVRFTAQYCRNCAIVWRDGYLINGQPYVVRRGKLIKARWYRWEVKEIKSK